MALTKIKTGGITDSAVTTAKINNNAVTDAKVADAITVTAATISGSTLASGVTASSLTSVGTLTGLSSSDHIVLNNNKYFKVKDTAGSDIRVIGLANSNDVYVGFIDDATGTGNLYLRTSATNALTIDSSQNATFAGNIVGKTNSSITYSAGDATTTATGGALNVPGSDIVTGRLFLQGSSNSGTDLIGFNNETNQLALYNYTDGAYIIKFEHSGATTFTGDIKTTNHEVVHETGFGYDASTYKVIQFGGDKGGNKTISLGYDPSENDNGSFAGSGDEILTRKAVTWKTPNTNDDGWHTPMAWNDGDIIMYGLLTLAHDSNEKLHLQGSTQPLIRWKEGTTNKAYIQWQDDGGWHFVNEEASGHIYMHTNSGNFNVVGDAGTVEIDSDGSTMSFSRDGTNKIRTTGASSILQMVAESNGQELTNSATSWSQISDEKLKSNWTMFENATDKINTLTKIGTFNPVDEETKKADTKRKHIGISADEVKKVLPTAVYEGEDGYLRLCYQDVFVLMLKSIQELSAKVEALENA